MAQSPETFRTLFRTHLSVTPSQGGRMIELRVDPGDINSLELLVCAGRYMPVS